MRKTLALIAFAVILSACGRNEPTPRLPSSKGLDENLAAALAHPEKATQLTVEPSGDPVGLPRELWTLTNLRELNISCSERLNELPPEVGKLHALEKLVIDCGNGSSMNISLPEEIGNLRNLAVLRLYGAMDPREAGEGSIPLSRFKHLPDAIQNLTSLKELDLGRNGLPDVPPQIAHLENLETLDLSFNEIHELPQFVGNLKKLRELSMEGNHSLKFPASLSQIKGLKVIAGNNNLDLKNQELLRRRFPDFVFEFENEFDDCAANEPAGGYEDWYTKSCGALPAK